MFKIYHFKKLDSTNNKIKEYMDEGTVVVADTQTKARGRFKRKWSSSKGGLWLSILLKPKDTEKLAYLTFCTAIACQKAIKKAVKVEAKLKWPNDLVMGKKKLCGILTEAIFGNNSLAIVGTGINTNNRIPTYLKNKATSLKEILSKKVNNKDILKYLLKNFELLYKKYKNKKYSSILKEWKKLSDTVGRDIKVITRDKSFRGKAIDISKDCSLIIKLRNNTKIKVTEADIIY